MGLISNCLFDPSSIVSLPEWHIGLDGMCSSWSFSFGKEGLKGGG
jgi:hypothetical protein